MKKIIQLCISIVAFFSIITNVFAHNTWKPHPYFWAFGGSEPLGRTDILLPIFDQCNSLSYLDVQGEVGKHDEWYAGTGAGYRRVVNNNRIYGGYLFLDNNQSSQHHSFWVLSPGFETLTCACDFRVNGYIPVSRKTKYGAPFFRSNIGCIDTNCNSPDIEFAGHQEFQHRFAELEEVGPGADIEVGHKFCNGGGVYAGAYAFRLQNVDDIRGLEGRLEFPLKGSNVMLAAEASYDNYEHGRFLAGIRVQLDKPVKACCPTPCICNRMYDPVVRNLGSVGRGTGIPVAKTIKDQGRFLIRDNIYFFTGNGGVPFAGTGTGTFANPLAADQFNQTTVTAVAGLAPSANFFLAPGTYTITPNDPNGRISFANGQSVFGRTSDYTCSAMGNERPLVLGGFDLLEGNNTISSIQLVDSVQDNTGVGAHITTLNIQNAPNIELCNDQITANINEFCPLSGESFATAINANNSEVTIKSSNIRARIFSPASVEGGFPVIAAVGIGGVVGETSPGNTFTGNRFDISDSAITSLSLATSMTNALNLSSGIGSIVAPSVSNPLTGAFNDNVFTIRRSVIISNALSPGEAVDSDNVSVGVGPISGHNPGGLNQFDNNDFTFIETSITASAELPALGSLNSVNSSVGVGSDNGFNGNAEMQGNTLSFNKSSIAASTSSGTIITSQSPFINRALGIGVTGFAAGANSFENNIVSLKETAISAQAVTEVISMFSDSPSQNIAIGIGSTTFGGATAVFDNNAFTADQLSLSANATILNNQLIVGSLNEAIGIGIDNTIPNTSFNNNDFLITKSLLNVEALIQGINQGTNHALGLFAGNGTLIQLLDSTANITALINFTNTGTNTATATQTAGTGSIISTGTTFTVTQNP